MSHRDEVDVVIVTYNAEPVLSACLTALQGESTINVVVVDNGSKDLTTTIAEAAGAKVIRAGTNLGFAVACNIGASRGRAHTLLFLNPDAVVSASDVLTAARAMQDLGAGVLGVRLVQADGTFDHAAKRIVVRPLQAGAFLLKRRSRSQYLAPHVDEFATGQVDSVNGAFMMMPRTTFEEVGGFDERYWMYIEDIDLCWRVKLAGHPVVYWPDVTALHLKSATTGRSRTPTLNYHFHRSMWIFYTTHQADGDSALVRVAVFLGLATRCAWVTARDLVRRARGVGRPVPRTVNPPAASATPDKTPDLALYEQT